MDGALGKHFTFSNGFVCDRLSMQKLHEARVFQQIIVKNKVGSKATERTTGIVSRLLLLSPPESCSLDGDYAKQRPRYVAKVTHKGPDSSARATADPTGADRGRPKMWWMQKYSEVTAADLDVCISPTLAPTFSVAPTPTPTPAPTPAHSNERSRGCGKAIHVHMYWGLQVLVCIWLWC